MFSLLVLIPGAAVLLFTSLEMPHKAKKVFFKIPIWISSSAISLVIGTVCRGVMGPATGFLSELILFPGLYFTKKHFDWKEDKINNPDKKKVKVKKRK